MKNIKSIPARIWFKTLYWDVTLGWVGGATPLWRHQMMQLHLLFIGSTLEAIDWQMCECSHPFVLVL